MAIAGRPWFLRLVTRLWWLPVVLLGLLIDRGFRVRWFLTPAIVVLTASVATIGKLVFRRPRPGTSMSIAPLGRLGAAGFPSTHTSCAFAIAGWQRHSPTRRWLHMLAIGIGYMRVRRRAHYRGDVVAGAILGYGIGWQVDGVWSRLASARAVSSPRRVGDPVGCRPNDGLAHERSGMTASTVAV